MNYSIEKIKDDYKKYIKHYNPKNFLRKFKNYKNFLINYFNLPDNSKSGLIIYLLEGKIIPKCQICNKNAKFINYEKGFRITCGNKKCQNEFVKNKFKNKSKEEKIIKKCEFCGKNFKSKTPTRKYCDTCKNDIFKCLECKIVKHKNERCKELSHISICKGCSLEYIFKNDWIKNYCELPPFYICKNCGKIIYGKTKNNANKKIEYCPECRKICPVCGKRFEGQNLCCSKECYKKYCKYTRFIKYGDDYYKKCFPNKIDFWINKGYSKKQALFNTYLHQSNNPKFQTIEEFEKYIKYNFNLFKNYSENLFLNIIGLNDTLKTIYKKFYSKKYIFGNENIFIKYRKDNSKGGNIYYIDYNNKVFIFKSNKEFYFFNLLKKHNIKFKNEKKYPNSNMRYDFYLIDYNIFIEIAGYLKNDEYMEKMNFKESKFGAIILKSEEEMTNFIKELINEN